MHIRCITRALLLVIMLPVMSLRAGLFDSLFNMGKSAGNALFKEDIQTMKAAVNPLQQHVEAGVEKVVDVGEAGIKKAGGVVGDVKDAGSKMGDVASSAAGTVAKGATIVGGQVVDKVDKGSAVVETLDDRRKVATEKIKDQLTSAEQAAWDTADRAVQAGASLKDKTYGTLSDGEKKVVDAARQAEIKTNELTQTAMQRMSSAELNVYQATLAGGAAVAAAPTAVVSSDPVALVKPYMTRAQQVTYDQSVVAIDAAKALQGKAADALTVDEKAVVNAAAQAQQKKVEIEQSAAARMEPEVKTAYAAAVAAAAPVPVVPVVAVTAAVVAAPVGALMISTAAPLSDAQSQLSGKLKSTELAQYQQSLKDQQAAQVVAGKAYADMTAAEKQVKTQGEAAKRTQETLELQAYGRMSAVEKDTYNNQVLQQQVAATEASLEGALAGHLTQQEKDAYADTQTYIDQADGVLAKSSGALSAQEQKIIDRAEEKRAERKKIEQAARERMSVDEKTAYDAVSQKRASLSYGEYDSRIDDVISGVLTSDEKLKLDAATDSMRRIQGKDMVPYVALSPALQKQFDAVVADKKRVQEGAAVRLSTQERKTYDDLAAKRLAAVAGIAPLVALLTPPAPASPVGPTIAVVPLVPPVGVATSGGVVDVTNASAGGSRRRRAVVASQAGSAMDLKKGFALDSTLAPSLQGGTVK